MRVYHRHMAVTMAAKKRAAQDCPCPSWFKSNSPNHGETIWQGTLCHPPAQQSAHCTHFIWMQMQYDLPRRIGICPLVTHSMWPRWASDHHGLSSIMTVKVWMYIVSRHKNNIIFLQRMISEEYERKMNPSHLPSTVPSFNVTAKSLRNFFPRWSTGIRMNLSSQFRRTLALLSLLSSFGLRSTKNAIFGDSLPTSCKISNPTPRVKISSK